MERTKESKIVTGVAIVALAAFLFFGWQWLTKHKGPPEKGSAAADIANFNKVFVQKNNTRSMLDDK